MNLNINIPKSLCLSIKSAGEVAFLNAWNLWNNLMEEKKEPPKYMSPTNTPIPESGSMSPLAITQEQPKLITIPVVKKSVSFGSVDLMEIPPKEHETK